MRPIHIPPRTRGAISASLEGSHRDPRLCPTSPPRLRVVELPSSRQLISASLEATPRRKGQMALPLTRPSYGGIKCQPLLHSAQDRWRQAAIPHSGCDRSPVRQLRSLLRHPGRCGNTVGPATWDEAHLAQFSLLFCQLRLSGLHLITRTSPDPPPAREGVRRHHVPLKEGHTALAAGGPDLPPLEGSGTSTRPSDLLSAHASTPPRGSGTATCPATDDACIYARP